MNLSERLRGVRSGMKLTLESVSGQTGLGVSTLSEFENGKREPRIGQLKQLADAYHRPVGYFLDEYSPPNDLVLWRKRPESPTAERTEARLIELADQYHTLEVLCDQSSLMDLPRGDGNADNFNYSLAGRLARRVREDLGLGDRPGQTLLRVLEEARSVKVFHLAFEPSGTAACTLADRFGAAILLNSRNVSWRRTFDLAHELFHLLTWDRFRRDDSAESAGPSPLEEKLATCFARNLLMPSEVFREAVDSRLKAPGQIDSDALLEVAREFDVSVEAVLWQMGFVYKIPSETIRATLNQLQRRMDSRDQSIRDAPPERPSRFLALARQALRKGLISTGRYAEFVGISRREAMRVIEEDAEIDVQIEVAHS